MHTGRNESVPDEQFRVDLRGPDGMGSPSSCADFETFGSVPILGHCGLCRYRDMLQCPDMSTETSPSEGEFRIYAPASLGDAIRHYRNEAGLTQEQLASMVGLNRTYLARLEAGKETEQLTRIFRIFRNLGVRMTLEKADW
jgi:DNA-binding XRE family transcriptional regulator